MFYEGLRLWEARFVVFYEGLRLWEARFVVFYEGLRLWGGSGSNQPVTAGGSVKEDPHVRGGAELGSYELRCELEVELGSYEFK